MPVNSMFWATTQCNFGTIFHSMVFTRSISCVRRQLLLGSQVFQDRLTVTVSTAWSPKACGASTRARASNLTICSWPSWMATFALACNLKRTTLNIRSCFSNSLIKGWRNSWTVTSRSKLKCLQKWITSGWTMLIKPTRPRDHILKCDLQYKLIYAKCDRYKLHAYSNVFLSHYIKILTLAN